MAMLGTHGIESLALVGRLAVMTLKRKSFRSKSEFASLRNSKRRCKQTCSPLTVANGKLMHSVGGARIDRPTFDRWFEKCE